MIKKTLKSGIVIGTSIGVTIGSIIIPRLLFPWRYNSTFPPIVLHALLSFICAYAGSFLIILLIEWIKLKLKKQS